MGGVVLFEGRGGWAGGGGLVDDGLAQRSADRSSNPGEPQEFEPCARVDRIRKCTLTRECSGDVSHIVELLE